jgi:hypothetical protein
MLLAAVSVLVVVASSDPADGSTPAIEQALHSALMRDATIVVRPASRETDDDALAAMAATEHATLLGVVVWSDRHRRASIRFVRVPGSRWTDREVRFDSADAPPERGRTVGFALASMMPDEAFEDHPPPAAPPRAEEAAPPATVPATPSPLPAPADSRAPTAPLRANPLAIDASALAVSAPAGYGGGIGGAFALRVPIVGALGARAALSARGEAIGPAQATSRVIVGGAGLAWQPWLDRRHRWAAGARVDTLVLQIDVAHLSEDDAQAAHLSRFMMGIDAAAEATFRFAEHASLIGAVGTEVVFGRTDLFVHERHVASLTPARLLVELGLRVSFQ